MIVDANGDEYESEALSGVEHPQGCGPIVWVNRPLFAGGHQICPWPAESVRPFDGGVMV